MEEPASNKHGGVNPRTYHSNHPDIYESVLTGFWVVYARHVFLFLSQYASVISTTFSKLRGFSSTPAATAGVVPRV